MEIVLKDTSVDLVQNILQGWEGIGRAGIEKHNVQVAQFKQSEVKWMCKVKIPVAISI